MTREEAIRWLSNLKKDIGKTQHQKLWHYEQALDEIIQTLKQEQAWIPDVEREEEQMASEMRDYCERYEPTYNSEDGSM